MAKLKEWSNRFWRDNYNPNTEVYTCTLFESQEVRNCLGVLSYKVGARQANGNIKDKTHKVRGSNLEEVKVEFEKEVLNIFGMSSLND